MLRCPINLKIGSRFSVFRNYQLVIQIWPYRTASSGKHVGRKWRRYNRIWHMSAGFHFIDWFIAGPAALEAGGSGHPRRDRARPRPATLYDPPGSINHPCRVRPTLPGHSFVRNGQNAIRSVSVRRLEVRKSPGHCKAASYDRCTTAKCFLNSVRDAVAIPRLMPLHSSLAILDGERFFLLSSTGQTTAAVLPRLFINRH